MSASKPILHVVDGRLVIDFPTLEDAMQLLSPWHGAARRAEAVQKIVSALGAANLEVELRANGRTLARLVSGRLQGPLLPLLGLSPAPAE